MSSIQEIGWGMMNNKPISLYTLTNSQGMMVRLINYGSILKELRVPDRDGKRKDVVLGFDTLDGYQGEHPYFGATVGRVANRIARGAFSLEGKNYALAPNDGPNHLHGGIKGFDKQVWDVPRAGQGLGDVFVKMSYKSIDGDQGYPGILDVTVIYVLTHDNILRIEFEAMTDTPTIVNLANHSYFNLAGHDAGTILDHEVMISADRYTPVDANRIPTGELAPVAGTPFDFTTPKTIGTDIGRLPILGPDDPGGYDHNYVINDADDALKPAATVTDPGSGRVMEVHTNQPGIQFYTGNFLDGSVTGKGETVYKKHAGLCFETQGFPDAINKEGMPGWPSVILRPGEIYRHEVEYRFSTKN